MQGGWWDKGEAGKKGPVSGGRAVGMRTLAMETILALDRDLAVGVGEEVELEALEEEVEQGALEEGLDCRLSQHLGVV